MKNILLCLSILAVVSAVTSASEETAQAVAVHPAVAAPKPAPAKDAEAAEPAATKDEAEESGDKEGATENEAVGTEPSRPAAAAPSPAADAPSASTKAEPTPAPAAPVPAAVETAAPKPSAAQDTVQAQLQFMKRELDANDKKLWDPLLRELNVFLEAYREQPDCDSALWLRAQLLDKQADYYAEAVDLLRLAHEYPDSGAAPMAKAKLAELGARRLKRDAAVLSRLSKGPEAGSRPDRLAALLQGLSALADERFVPARRAELEEFLRRYPAHPKADAVVRLSAANEAVAEDYRASALQLRKLLALFPESQLRPDALVALGETYALRLKDYDKSAATYRELAAAYPDRAEARLALERIAELQESKLGKYPEAVGTLEEIAKKYAGEAPALKALEGIARLQRSRLKTYAEVVRTDNRIADAFKGDPAVRALKEAADVAGGYARNYPLQIENLQRLVKEYPDRPEAPEALFGVGEAYFYQLQDLDKAEAAYGEIKDKYEKSDWAAKAASRLEKIQKKRAAK